MPILKDYVNLFEEKSQWIGQVPAFLFSLIAGALSDKYGKTKVLMIIPLVGHVFQSVILTILTFFENAPFELFYFERLWSFFGGMSVYYLGAYGFGSKISTEKNRSARLARLDGSEQMAVVFGSYLSPKVFQVFGYTGSFAVRIVTDVIAILWMIIMVKEPPSSPAAINDEKSNPLTKFVIRPFVEMLKTVFKKRETRYLILLQLFAYGLYWLAFQEIYLEYFYLYEKFSIESESYSSFYSVKTLAYSFGLLVVMPLISQKLHSGFILIAIDFSVTIGLVCQALAVNFNPQFYAFKAGITFMNWCVYATARSLCLTCVNEDEVGKLFSAFAILSAIVPFGANPIYRRLYDATHDNPDTINAIYYLTAAVMGLAGCIHTFCYLAIKRFEKNSIVINEDPKK